MVMIWYEDAATRLVRFDADRADSWQGRPGWPEFAPADARTTLYRTGDGTWIVTDPGGLWKRPHLGPERVPSREVNAEEAAEWFVANGVEPPEVHLRDDLAIRRQIEDESIRDELARRAGPARLRRAAGRR